MEQRDVSMTWEPDKPHEECGVFGIYDFDGNDIASTITMDYLHSSTEGRKAVVLQYQTPKAREK